MIVKRLAGIAAGALIALTAASAGFAQPPAAGQAQAAAAAEAARVAALPRQNLRLAQGRVSGVVENGAARFMGLPYAAPPVGDLRWRSPRPAAAWSGVRDASKPGANCGGAEEDCLYLNVYKPETARPGARMPVMVWIHGGAFTGGAGTGGFGASHDGTAFARQDVVTVTINYRLGRAGWFAHPALQADGQGANFGLEDQIAALRWVRDNIASFGGDPRDVTIFGESAGAMSVLYLMTAPQAQGLFHAAISESGFPRHQPTPLSVAQDFAVGAAREAGVTGTNAAAAAALRALPLSAIPGRQGQVDPSRPYPILDGKTITSTLIEAFEAGRQAKVPLMIGGNSNEASLRRPTVEQLAAMPDRDAVRRLFNVSGSASDLQIINDYVTHQEMTEPNRHLARLHTRAGQPVYLFYFSFVPVDERERYPLGARHVAEIPYVFASIPDAAGENLATQQAMNAYWAAFAKYDNPAAAGGVLWPRYDPANDAQIEFGNDGVAARTNQLDPQLDYLEAAAR